MAIERRDPALAIDRLREREPVYWVEELGFWVITGYEAVRTLFADPRVTADPRAFDRDSNSSSCSDARWALENPFFGDSFGELGTGRGLVSTALTPRAVARLEKVVRVAVDQYAAPLQGRRGVVD